MPTLVVLMWMQAVELIDHFGIIVGGAVILLSVMGSVVLFLDRRSDRLYALRLHEQEVQYEARLREQKEQYEARLTALDIVAGYQRALLNRGIDLQDLTLKELGPRSR